MSTGKLGTEQTHCHIAESGISTQALRRGGAAGGGAGGVWMEVKQLAKHVLSVTAGPVYAMPCFRHLRTVNWGTQMDIRLKVSNYHSPQP